MFLPHHFDPEITHNPVCAAQTIVEQTFFLQKLQTKQKRTDRGPPISEYVVA